MAQGYFQLPAYRPGGQIDFEPVGNALTDLVNTRQRQQQFDQQNRNALMQHSQWQAQNSRAQEQLQMQRREFDIKAADAPLDRRYREAQIGLATAQARAAGQKNALEEAIAGMLSESGGAPEGGNSLMQPQSYNAAQQNPDIQLTSNALAPQAQQAPRPGIQMVADETPVLPQQQSPSAVYSLPGGESVNTPMGPMSRDKARRLGMGLAASGKGEAGRMMIEAASGGGGLQKPTQNAIEERTLNSATQLGRLDDIEKRFDPQFLEIPKRLQMTGLSWSAKLGQGDKLSPDQRGQLQRYAAFRSSSVNNLNTILKELSGAAVTPQEYERIQNDQPVAGTGIFDGDDPVSFRAKLDRTKQTLRAAIARQNFIKARGLNFDRNSIDQFMKLDDVPGAIEQRGVQIEQQLRQQNPQIQPQVLEEMTTRQLKQEFGI